MVIEHSNGRLERDAFLDAPIPTYEEAISRPSSSQSVTRPLSSADAEREGLLANRNNESGYRRPTVESVPPSPDSELFSSILGLDSDASSTEELRQEIEEMGIIDPEEHVGPLLGTGRLSKHLTSLTHTLSNLHLPHFRPSWLPHFTRLLDHLPPVKFNWILLGRFFALLLVLVLAYLLFLSNLFRTGRTGASRNWIDPEALRLYFLDHVDGNNIRDSLEYLTSYAHIAGTDGGHTQAQYIEAMFNKHLVNVGKEQFDVYLNYPKEEKGTRRVSIVDNEHVLFDALIEEDAIYDEPQKQNAPVYHGYSKSETVKGPLIYANYGRSEDFRYLKDNNIEISGAVILMRHGKQDGASMIQRAASAGAKGGILFSDPSANGFVKGETSPRGRYLPTDGVRRGSVALSSSVIGDPLSAGFASTPSESRRDRVEGNLGLVHIPSIPLAWRDAERLLQALEGHGFQPEAKWGIEGINHMTWWSGASSSPSIELKNELDEIERRPIYNILGEIEGIEQSEKKLIVGTHRDAWCFGGAGSGGATAVLLEIIRLFGEVRSIGWRPLRTIQFASWDAREFNMVGSTEHVEAEAENIRRDAFAYLNIDVAVVGPEFHAAASPVLQQVILHVLDQISDPESNKTLRAAFAESGAKIHAFGAEGDHAPFQMLAGCSSMDIGFAGLPFPRHSCYDTLEWIENFGDPGFTYHKLMAQIMGLLILDLADREVLPFDFEAYADTIHDEVEVLEKSTNEVRYLDYSRLHTAAQELANSAKTFREWSQAWSNTVYGSGAGFESKELAIKRMSHNTRMANFETHLLDLEGLEKRKQFKHILMGPSRFDSSQPLFFPGIRDAIDDQEWDSAQRQIVKVAEMLSNASNKLIH